MKNSICKDVQGCARRPKFRSLELPGIVWIGPDCSGRGRNLVQRALRAQRNAKKAKPTSA